MICCPLLGKSGQTKGLGFAVRSLYSYTYNVNNCSQQGACTLYLWGLQAESSWLAKEHVSEGVCSPSSGHPANSDFKQLLEVKVREAVFEKDWGKCGHTHTGKDVMHLFLLRNIFPLSRPKTGGFADQFSVQEHQDITLVFEIKGEQTTSYSSRIWIPPRLPLEDTWLILAALLSLLLLQSCQDPEHF